MTSMDLLGLVAERIARLEPFQSVECSPAGYRMTRKYRAPVSDPARLLAALQEWRPAQQSLSAERYGDDVVISVADREFIEW